MVRVCSRRQSRAAPKCSLPQYGCYHLSCFRHRLHRSSALSPRQALPTTAQIQPQAEELLRRRRLPHQRTVPVIVGNSDQCKYSHSLLGNNCDTQITDFDCESKLVLFSFSNLARSFPNTDNTNSCYVLISTNVLSRFSLCTLVAGKLSG